MHADDDRRHIDDRLIEAARHGASLETILLLRAGANVHAQDAAALRLAAKNGHTETVMVLLAAGADPSVHNYAAGRRAIEAGHTETALVLYQIEQGAM